MCWKCQDIDQAIAHCRVLSARLADELAQARLNRVIEQLEAEKKALHPDRRAFA
jgi:hypothetical protein